MSNTKGVGNKITKNTELLVRIVLFLAFFGHGLVSLGFSPSEKLHRVLLESINFWDLSVADVLIYQGIADIILAFAILFQIKKPPAFQVVMF